MRDHTPDALVNARRLRRELSLPEVLLWRLLRGRPLGVKFRNQHPIGKFVADFYGDAAKLVVEIGGIAHDMGDRPVRDQERDAWLEKCGRQVIRISACEVLANPQAVAEFTLALCTSAPPPSALRAATSPGRGGSFSGVAH